MLGQVILVAGTLLTILFMLSWHPALADTLGPLAKSAEKNYKLIVDILIGGAIGVGFYFWFSGRVWCRFACPLAALMHIYARFTRFRIFADKKKCISCNVCTSVCHQGIDIMNFANKGLPMEDPECVRLFRLRPKLSDGCSPVRPIGHRRYADLRLSSGFAGSDSREGGDFFSGRNPDGHRHFFL